MRYKTYTSYKTYTTYPRWAIWMLTILLVVQTISPLARAQEETTSSETASTDQQTQQSSSESNSSQSTSSVGNLQMPDIPAISTLLQNWHPDPDEDDDANEVPASAPSWSPEPDPDDDAHETPSVSNVSLPTPSVPDTGTIDSSSNSSGNSSGSSLPLNNSAWWQGLTPSGSSSSSSQTMNDILDLWKKIWTPTQNATINTPNAGTGENTGGILIPATAPTSTPTSTPVITPLTDGSQDLGGYGGESPTTTASSTEDDTVGVSNNNQGEGNYINDVVDQTDTSIVSNKVADVTNRDSIISDSGNNLIEFGQRGEGGITTGGVNTNAEGEFQLNTTKIRELPSSNTGCSDCWSVWNMGSSAKNNGTGEDSQNQATADVEREFTVVNNNVAYLGNSYLISGNTGRNAVNAGWSFKDGWIETGSATVYSNVINKVNTNLIALNGVEAKWRPMVLNIKGSHQEDIDLFEMLFGQFGGTRGIQASAANNNTGEDSLNLAAASFEENLSITNDNSGLIENDFVQEAVTGQNSIFAGSKIKRTNLKTSKANSVFNLFNFLNTNIVGGEASVIALNIFGDFKGNILLPDFSAMFGGRPNVASPATASASISGAEGDSINQAIALASSDTEITVQNFGGVVDEIRNRALSGNNQNVFGEEVDGLTVKTGNAKSQTNIDTTANLTCIGCGLFTGAFNILGQWTGGVIGLPTDARRQEKGKSFVVSVDDAMPGISGMVNAQATIDGTGDDSFNGSVASAERKVTIKNTNEGAVMNKVDALSDTGNNTIAALDGRDILVETGESLSAVNVGTMVNTDIIGGKLVKIAVNLFGTWDGNFVIGNPTDLSITLIAASTPNPVNEGGIITYTVTIRNAADGKPTNATVTTTYDAAKTTLQDAGEGTAGNGTVIFTFYDLQPDATATAQYKVKVKTQLGAGIHTLPASATVSASRGDNNNANDTATAPVSFTITSGGNSQDDQNNSNNNNNNDEGTVGGAILPGSGSGIGSANTGGGTATNNNEVWTITKSNTVPSAGVAPGSTVPYKIVLQNNHGNPINDVKVYDKVKNTQGMVVFENAWDLGQVAPNEKVVIDYTIVFSLNAPDGIYTNTAYTSGFDILNQVQKSSNATSQVRINSMAPLFVGTVEGAPSGGIGSAAGGSATASNTATTGTPAASGPDAWTTLNSNDDQLVNGIPAALPEDSPLVLFQSNRRNSSAAHAVKAVSEGFINRISVKGVSAAGLNPSLLSGISDARIDRSTPFGGAVAGTDSASQAAYLMIRTALFGLMSLFCFLIAILFARRRRGDNEKVHNTPYWML